MTDHIVTDLYDSGSDPTTASLPPMVPDFRPLTRAEVIDGTRPPEIAPEAWAKYFAPPCMDRSAAGTRRAAGDPFTKSAGRRVL